MVNGWDGRTLAPEQPLPHANADAASIAFIARPTALTWYRAHNVSIAAAYLDHEDLARTEGRIERYFLNVVLVRVLFAHAMVAAPRLALGWLGPVAPLPWNGSDNDWTRRPVAQLRHDGHHWTL